MLGTCTLYLARLASLREAADVLRTYRRAAGEKRKAKVNGKAWALHFQKHYVTKCEVQQKERQKSLKASQNSVWDFPIPSKIEPWDGPWTQNLALKLYRTATRQPRVSKKPPRQVRSCPRASKSWPNDAQESTKPFQNRPLDVFLAQSL